MKAAGRRALLTVIAGMVAAITPAIGGAQAVKKKPKPTFTEADRRPAGMPPGMAVPTSLRVPTTFDELFAERDTRALNALNYLRCLQNTVRGVQSGLLGQVPRAWLMSCVQQGEEWRGVFAELSEEAPGIKVRAQFAVRGTGMPVRDAIDTVKVNGVMRAMLRGITAPLPGGGKYQFMPVPLPQKTFIEVWFLPVPTTPAAAVVGGDSLIQMSLDGTRELGHSRTSPPVRTVQVTSGSEYLLRSTEERIPLLSELMVAHMALSVANDVRVRTYQIESVFTRGLRTVRHVTR